MKPSMKSNKTPKPARRFLIISIIVVIILAILGYIITTIAVNDQKTTTKITEGTGQEGRGNTSLNLTD